MSHPLNFLNRKAPKITFSISQFADMGTAVILMADTLQSPNRSGVTSIAWGGKLVSVCLIELAERIKRKEVFPEQSTVKFTFKHPEALAFLHGMTGSAFIAELTDTQRLAVQFTIDQLHKNYI